MGFVWFIAGFDDLNYEQKAEDKAGAGRLLQDAKAIVERKVFEYAPIDLQKIAAMVPKEVHDVSALAKHLSEVKQGELAKAFEPLVSLEIPEESKATGDPVDLALAYYLHKLLRQIHPARTPALHRTDKKEVRLAADCDGWVLVKKINLASAEKKEVLGGLVGMHQTLMQKVPEFCAQGFEEYEQKVEKTLSAFPQRKSFARLQQTLSAIQAPELKTEDAELEEYALVKALEHAGFPPYISGELFSSLYPELKIPKPRGNFGGKKKK